MFSVKSYKTGRKTTEHEFYVLCKGNNSGRPSHTPQVNSFVVMAGSSEEKDHLYWLSYALWKSRGFEPFLRGSVIPFITIREYSHLLRERQTAAPLEVVGKVVKVLATLDESEAAACRQLQAIMQMRQLILQKVLR
jgi:hypothetical protein